MNIDNEDFPEVMKVSLESDSYIYLSKVINIFFEAIRGIRYHIAIDELVDKKENNNKNYLIQLSGVNYDMAVIKWCKLFGSSASQDTHYMHLMRQSDLQPCLSKLNINSQDDLKKDLLKNIGIEQGVFDNYIDDSILKYRDKFVAHFDLAMHIKYYDSKDLTDENDERLKTLPTFDIAIKSLYWLYDLIAIILRCKKGNGDGKDWAVLTREKIERRLSKEIAPLIEQLGSS